MQRLGIEPKMNAATVAIIFGKFLYLFLASLLMGLLLGLFSALLLKNFNVSQTPQVTLSVLQRSSKTRLSWPSCQLTLECTVAHSVSVCLKYLAVQCRGLEKLSSNVGIQAVGVIGMVAYLSYLVGDYIGLSGIVALFCCSVTMSHYALHNISKAQRAGTMSAFETLSFLSEGAIFVYVGLDALDPMKWKVILRPQQSHACLANHKMCGEGQSCTDGPCFAPCAC